MTDQEKSKKQLIEELEEMRRQAAHWHSIVTNTPAFVCLVDRNGKLQYFNRTVEGVAAEEAVDKTIYDFVDVAYWATARACIERVFDTRQPGSCELVSAGPNGSKAWYEVHVGPVNDGDRLVGATLVSIDISRRKQVEEALAEREAQLLEAQEVASLGFYVVDLATGNCKTSSVLDKVFGMSDDYPRTLDSWSDLLHPDERTKMWDYFQSVVKERQFFDCKYRIIRHGDNQVRWVHGLGRLHLDDGGQPISMLGTVQDITSQKLAEEAQRESEERFKLFMDNSPAIAWVKDEQGRYVYVSRSFENRLDVRLDHLRGKTDLDFWEFEVAEQFRRNDQTVLAGGQAMEVYEETFDSDGQRCYWSCLKFPFRDAAGSRFIGGIGIEITARKRAEMALQKAHDELELRVEQRTADLAKANEHLRQSELRYRTVVEDQTEVICRIKVDGTIMFVNDVYCRIFGKTREELLGHKWQPLVVLEDVPMIEDRIRMLSQSNPIVIIENRIYSSSGEVRWMQFVNRGFFDQEGMLQEVQAVGRDITERKQAEEALAKEYRNIKHLLHSSDHERQLIAYEIHDGLAQQLAGAIMQLQAYGFLKEKQPDDAADAIHAATTMLQQGYYEARRLIAGVRPPILDESGVVEAISHLVHEQGRGKGPKIDFHSRVAFGRLDPTLENALYRIAQEALTNAYKHSRSKMIWVSLLQRGDRLRIEIRDWGAGFDTETVARGRFGLEGIRQRARLLGGKCSIKSKPGRGTRVSVVLPVVLRDEG